MAERPPVLITSMFRSGTALLTRILSADPSFEQTYWEPLHPELPEQVRSYDHYEPYNNRFDLLEKWDSSFARDSLIMKSDTRAPALRSYLNLLLNENTLVKTVRCQLRLGWVLNHFDDVRVIHLVRDPRAVCYSYVKKGYTPTFYQRVKSNIPGLSMDIGTNSRRVSLDVYETNTYLKVLQSSPRWSDLFERINGSPPYIHVLALWKALVTECREALQKNPRSRWTEVRYEEVCAEPEKALDAMYQLMQSPVPDRVLKNATGEAVHWMGGHKKWQRKISTRWMDEWKRKNSEEIWRVGVEQCQLEPLMHQYGYD